MTQFVRLSACRETDRSEVHREKRPITDRLTSNHEKQSEAVSDLI